MGFKPFRQLDFRDFVPQCVLHKPQQFPVLLILLLNLLAVDFRFQAEILVRNVAELLVGVLHHHLEGEFVDIVGQIEDLKTLVFEQFGLGQPVDPVGRLPAGVINILLILFHPAHILVQRHHLLFGRRVEEQQVLEQLFVGAVIRIDAVFQLQAEVLKEFLVFLPLVCQHRLELALNLFLQPGGDQFQLPVVLEHLTGDVQRQVLRIDKPLDKAEIVRQQFGALLHNQDAAGVKLQALLIVFGIEIIRHPGRDKEQGMVGGSALGAGIDHPGRRGIIEELVLIEAIVLLFGNLALGLLPDRDHAVQRAVFGVALIFCRLVVGAGPLFDPLAFDHHPDRIADIIRILFDQLGQPVSFKVFAESLIVVIGFEGQDDIGAERVLLRLFDGIPVGAVRLPGPGFVTAIRLGNDLDMVRHHKSGIEPDAELADDVDILFRFILLFESEGTALGDGAEVVFQLLGGHAAAVVRYGQRPGFLIRGQADVKVFPGHPVVFGQRLIIHLVQRVAGVGDQLPQEDLVVGVNRVDHQIQKPFGFRFKFLFCHKSRLPCIHVRQRRRNAN